MVSHFSGMNSEHKAVKKIANVGKKKPKGTKSLMENIALILSTKRGACTSESASLEKG